MVSKIHNYEFQNDCVNYLVDTTCDKNSKKTIIVKAPTGAGKTIILIKYVEEYLNNTDGMTAFVWLCPGKGNLEQQSMDKMDDLSSIIKTQDLLLALDSGFCGGSVTFINWELITKKGNTAIKDSERANLFDRIAQAHKDGLNFIIIIDEEHLNNTKKADDIINAFAAKNIIRVSATAQKTSVNEFYEIPEREVIDSGLITRAIYVNEGVDEKKEIINDYDYLLELADEKRKGVQANYDMLNIGIRPLVLIQFPAGKRETIEAVENKLKTMGYTYDNGMVSIWMSDDKKNLDELNDMNGSPVFLLMKQAISTGWDCPRAKILVKLREGGSEEFQIQTIGRIRRMPERKHYGIDLLDFCYVYTLDTKYEEGLLSAGGVKVRKVFLKNEARDFTLTKEMRNLDFDGLGERETLIKVYDYFVREYGLGKDKKVNKENLEAGGYIFSHEIESNVLKGLFRTIDDMTTSMSSHNVSVHTKVNTHTHGIYLLHSVDEIKKVTGLQSQKVKNILKRMFCKGGSTKYKFVALENSDFYAFVINNAKKLKIDLRNVTSQMGGAQSNIIMPKTVEFKIPEMETYRVNDVKKRMLMRMNAYKDYTNEFITEKTRSTSERLFERYCENSDAVKWVYKNGDTGQQYLSIVYTDFVSQQWLFYPDYIVKMKDGTTWIIETKGGEQSGHSKNIDKQVGNKFIAFKDYAEKYGVNWGFVRDVSEELYINNTEYSEEMEGNPNWRPLSDAF